MTVAVTCNIPAVIAAAPAKATAVVAKTTFDIRGGAAARSRVDTGDMERGWTAKLAGLHGVVESGPDYTIHNEFGTEKMSAQPMAIPAAEDARPGFYAGMAQVFSP